MPVSYLESAARQFKLYKLLGEKAIKQVNDDNLLWQANEDSNSVGMIVKHMYGNMLSRWTNFLTEDGEKTWRQRDTEFRNDLETRELILEKWEEGWHCLFDALDSITDDDLNKIIYIRNEGHSILDAINRQIAHYSYHVGQIVYIAKLRTTDDWESMSIPRNRSDEYNKRKFAQEKDIRHFTDDLLTPEK